MKAGLWAPRGNTARWVVLGAMVVNLIASLAMATVLRDATAAGGDVEARMTFIASHWMLVSAGWYSWVFASLGLVVVFVAVLRSLEPSPALERLVLFILLLGSVPDIVNNLIGAAILPEIAQLWMEADPSLREALAVDFLLWDRFSVLLTGALGNLMYAVAGFLLTWISWKNDDFPRPLVWLGIPLWTATLGIAVTSVADSVPGLVVTVAITMTLFCVWCTGIAVMFLGREA